MLCVYSFLKYLNFSSACIVFICQNLTYKNGHVSVRHADPIEAAIPVITQYCRVMDALRRVWRLLEYLNVCHLISFLSVLRYCNGVDA